MWFILNLVWAELSLKGSKENHVFYVEFRVGVAILHSFDSFSIMTLVLKIHFFLHFFLLLHVFNLEISVVLV